MSEARNATLPVESFTQLSREQMLHLQGGAQIAYLWLKGNGADVSGEPRAVDGDVLPTEQFRFGYWKVS